MHTKDALQSAMDMSLHVLKTYVSDLSDEDLMRRPSEGSNHLAWQLGHLISSEVSLLNSVCPGNFFEGPLWSDPEKGLFVQYLNAGKVPGATTVEEVREFYLSQVPMHRGCSPRDVTIAILYVYEQQYETGQALPVTGGQVMLK